MLSFKAELQAEDEEEAQAEADVELEAIAAGKKKCPRCFRWVKETIRKHLNKCWHFHRCNGWFTYRPRHQKTCKGIELTLPKAEKIICPVLICTERLHPSALLRHMSRRHSDQAEKYRKRTANAKTPQERRENRARFRAAHPEKVR